MIKYIDVSGKTEEEAIASALLQLGKDRDDVSVEIIERAKQGFFGIGSTQAVVRVSYESGDEAPAKTEPKAPARPEPRAARPESRAPAKTETRAKNKADTKAKADAPVRKTSPATGEEAGRVEAFLSGLLKHMDIEAEIGISKREDGGISAYLSGENMGAIIGRRGETLDAIQHLTNYAVNRGSDKHLHISVDAENYRSKREESLAHLAEKMAAKVIKYKRSMALEPMNSYERHIIHATLQDYEGVSTSSVGTEPNRRVVVSYDKQDGAPEKPQSREWR